MSLPKYLLSSERIHCSCVYFTVSCVGVNVIAVRCSDSIHQTVTRATECNSFPSGLPGSFRRVQDGITEWWVFLASSLLLRLISKPPTAVWVRRVKSETEVFTLILNLLSSPYNTLWLWKSIHKANTCVKMYKGVFLSFPYLRQRSLSQGQGLYAPKISLGQAALKIFTSSGRIMHSQPAAARLHCRLLIQGATTETRIFMV